MLPIPLCFPIHLGWAHDPSFGLRRDTGLSACSLQSLNSAGKICLDPSQAKLLFVISTRVWSILLSEGSLDQIRSWHWEDIHSTYWMGSMSLHVSSLLASLYCCSDTYENVFIPQKSEKWLSPLGSAQQLLTRKSCIALNSHLHHDPIDGGRQTTCEAATENKERKRFCFPSWAAQRAGPGSLCPVIPGGAWRMSCKTGLLRPEKISQQLFGFKCMDVRSHVSSFTRNDSFF